LEESARWDAEGIELAAKKDGSSYILSGTKLFVPDAHNANLLIVPARTSGAGTDGITLFLVDAKAKGVRTSLLKTMDQTRKVGDLLRRLGGGERRARSASRRVHGEGLLLRCVPCRRRRGHPDPRRYRLHLGTRHAHLLQTRQRIGGHLRRRDLEPRARRPGRA